MVCYYWGGLAPIQEKSQPLGITLWFVTTGEDWPQSRNHADNPTNTSNPRPIWTINTLALWCEVKLAATDELLLECDYQTKAA